MMNIVDERPYVEQVPQQLSQFERMLGDDLTRLVQKFQAIEHITNSMVQDEERRALAEEVDAAFTHEHVAFNLALFRLGCIVTLCRTHEMHRFIQVEGVQAETFDHWLSLRMTDTRSVAFAERAFKELKPVVAEIGMQALEVLPSITEDSLKAIAHSRQQFVRQTKAEAKQTPGFETMAPPEQNAVLQQIQRAQEPELKAAIVSAMTSPTEFNRQFNRETQGIVTKLAVPCSVVSDVGKRNFTVSFKVTREQLEHEIGDNQYFLTFHYAGQKGLTAGQLKELLLDEDLKTNF